MGTSDHNRSGVFRPYKDPEKVPMILLTIGLMVGLVIFLVWALETMSH